MNKITLVKNIGPIIEPPEPEASLIHVRVTDYFGKVDLLAILLLIILIAVASFLFVKFRNKLSKLSKFLITLAALAAILIILLDIFIK